MSSDDPLSHVQFGAVIKPGDRVLITMAREHLYREELDKLLDQLHTRFPDVEFAIVGGCSGLAVQPAAAEAERG